MGHPSRRLSVIMAVFAALLLVGLPQAAHAQASGSGVLQNADMSKCRDNMYKASIKRAQDKTVGLNKVWSNITPPTMATQCLQKVMTLLSSTLGTLTDPFGLIWGVVTSFIQNILSSICNQIMSVVSSAINMVKSALCIPIPSGSLSFSLGGGGGSFGGSSSCSGISLLGGNQSSPLNQSQKGPPLPATWQWYNNITPR